MLPTVVIYNEKLPPSEELFGALQATSRALIVREGEATTREIGGESFTMNLPDGVTVKMRNAVSLNADGTTGFQADVVAPKSESQDAAMSEALKNIKENTLTRPKNKTVEPFPTLPDDKDKPYAEMEFPNVEYRLLELFRFWNVINYFYPYKDLIGRDWNDVLPEYIAKFEADKNALDYQMTAKEMAAEMRDSHGFMGGVNI